MWDVQTLVVLAIVLAATLYLARRSWKAVFGRGGHCGSGCTKCGDNTVVQLDAPTKPESPFAPRK